MKYTRKCQQFLVLKEPMPNTLINDYKLDNIWIAEFGAEDS